MSEETPATPSPAPVIGITYPPRKRLLDREWLEIVSLAKEGTSPTKIAKIYGVHHTIIYRGLKKRGVRVGSMIAEATEEELERSREETVKRIKETKDTDYRFTEALQKKLVKIVLSAGDNPGRVLDDVKALKIALDGLKSGTNNKWRLLGLDRENEHADAVLPELPIREMTEHEVVAIRNRQTLEDGNLSPEELEAALGFGEDEVLLDQDDVTDEGDGEDTAF